MKHLLFRLVLVAVSIVTHATTSLADLSEAEFARLHQQLRPSADETWRSIPWKTSVLAAQHAAAEQRKPIFVWAMDGHPLGCT